MASEDGRDDDKSDSETLPEQFTPQRDQVAPYACVVKGAGDALAGAVMGSIFGFGSGLFKRQGFKGALSSGAASAKTFAILSGLHGFMTTLLVQIRGKKDATNAGIAGCVTGVALSAPGNPAALLQGCVTFGLFSYFIERMNTQTALAAVAAGRHRRTKKAESQWELPALPPFMLAPTFSEGLFIFNQPKIQLLKP